MAFGDFNIDNELDNLSNFSVNTSYKIFDVLSANIGRDMLFTLIFVFLGVAIFIKSDHSRNALIGYLIIVDVFAAVLIMPMVLLIFGLVTAFLAGPPIYNAVVRKR